MDALLDAFGIDWKLLLVQVVNFGLLMALLWHFLYKPVMKMLEERQALVAKGVEDAKKADELLGGADEEAKKRILQGDEEAERLIKDARQTAGEERIRLVKEAEIRAKRIEEDAKAKAEEASAKMFRESEREIARLAILAAEKVLKEKP